MQVFQCAPTCRHSLAVAFATILPSDLSLHSSVQNRGRIDNHHDKGPLRKRGSVVCQLVGQKPSKRGSEPSLGPL